MAGEWVGLGQTFASELAPGFSRGFAAGLPAVVGAAIPAREKAYTTFGWSTRATLVREFDATSVGTHAIKRIRRPVCLQDILTDLLTEKL